MAVSVYEVVRVAYQSRLSKTTLKQGAHIQQPTPWPVPHACAQLYHPGISSRFVLHARGQQPNRVLKQLHLQHYFNSHKLPQENWGGSDIT